MDIMDELGQKEISVQLYPISNDESYVSQAQNLFKKLIDEKGFGGIE